MTQGPSELISGPAFQRIVLDRHHIALAICQIRYNRKLLVEDASVVARFQNWIDATYPEVTDGVEYDVTVKGSFDHSNVETERKTSRRWEFRDTTDDWSVALTSTSLSLETRNYQGFEDFLERFAFLLQALTDVVNPTMMQRLGLRFINEIRMESVLPEETRWINPQILGPHGLVPSRGTIKHFQALTQVSFPTHNMNFQFGSFGGGTTVAPRPNQHFEDGPFVLLDMDAFVEPKARMVDPKGVLDDLHVFHSSIYEVFRSAVTDDFLRFHGGAIDE